MLEDVDEGKEEAEGFEGDHLTLQGQVSSMTRASLSPPGLVPPPNPSPPPWLWRLWMTSGEPGMDRVDDLAEYQVELRNQTSLARTNQQVWQNLLDYDKQGVLFAARHQSRLDTGRFRSPKKRQEFTQEFTPGVESVKSHAPTAPLTQWPDCCHLIETIFVRLCAVHRSPKKKGTGAVSRWDGQRGTAMGSGVTKTSQFINQKPDKAQPAAITAMKAAVLIQRWYRQYVARLEMRRRYVWNIFQSIEYSGEQAQIKLYNFLGYLMDNFTPSSTERNLICHIFRENEVCRDVEWERHFCYKNIVVPEIYSGPHLTFPLDVNQVAGLVDAFRNKRVWKLFRKLPNINRISTCNSKEITICGDLHGQLEDLLLIFYKNGMPSLERPYVFNGDFVDRGKDSIEILLILFSFLLVYPNDVHLNRGNHEDHIVNLRYGFTKEVLGKYKLHGKRILKLIHKIFSWLPLATVIDQKVLVLHGGISDTTDLCFIAKMERHKYMSTLRPPKTRSQSLSSMDSDMEDETWSAKDNQRRLSFTNPKPSAERNSFQRRSLQNLRLIRTEEEELEVRRRQLQFTKSGFSQTQKQFESVSSNSSQDADKPETANEWKQILDLLWSDPMPQDGCMPNEVRGGGCYWGPDVTEDFLNRHRLQLIIRSHECKQEGYEFCHGRRVLTLFSASNYYEKGSNRGAYVKLGPDLVPYLIQYQANSMTREISVMQSVRQTEHSALKVLQEQLFSHKSDLICAFQEYDIENTGLVSLNDWANAMESVMHLGLPWRMMRSQLVTCKIQDGMLNYYDWFQELSIKEPSMEHIEKSLLQTMYRHRSTLETIFRIVDTDNSGFITMEDFRQTWKLLSVYLKMEITDEAIADLAISIDVNQDGNIDIDEFMEAFRLTDKKSRLERGRSMFMGTATNLTKLEGDPDI